jgi:hypothetical protein
MAGTVQFKLETLGQYRGGQLAQDFNAYLEAAVDDCRRRPGQTKARELTVILKMTPNANDADDVDVAIATKFKMPSRELQSSVMHTTAKNQLRFALADDDEED